MIDYMEKFSLSGKQAAVVGGAGLLGREIATAFAHAGAAVLLMDVKASGGKEAAEQLREGGFDVRYVPFDVTSLKSAEGRIKRLWNSHGPIGVMVNASYPRTEDWGSWGSDIPLETWRKNVDMQLNSAFIIARTYADLMRDSKTAGSIINLGSIYGVTGNDFTIYENTKIKSPIAYSAIKGGIASLTRYMASYYGRFNIRVNTLCPGGIFDNQNPRFVKAYSGKTPLKRMGRPEEIASAALFLASDASSYVTGTAFMVDGGWTAI